jgi:hypothetical protein
MCSLREFILVENRDKIATIEKMSQLMIKRARKQTEEPEFFKKCLESKPFSENYGFKASSFVIRPVSMPIFVINLLSQNSVNRISK